MDQMPGAYGAGGRGLYPLDLGRILGLTFSLFRFRWRAFVGASLVIMAPLAVLFAYVQLVTPELTRWYAEIELVALGRSTEIPTVFPWEQFVLATVIGIVYGLGSLVAETAIARLAAVTFTGGHVTAGTVIRYALSRLSSLTGLVIVMQAAVLGILAVGLGLAALPLMATGGRVTGGVPFFLALVLVVAAVAVIVLLSLRWYLAVMVVALERRGPIEALRRSWRLVAGSTWRLLGYVIVFALIVGLISFAIIFVITFVMIFALLTRGSSPLPVTATNAADPFAAAVLAFVSALANAILMPIIYIGVTLLYSDLRWRHGEPGLTPGGGEPSLASLSE